MVQDLEKMKTNLNKLDSRTIQKKKIQLSQKERYHFFFLEVCVKGIYLWRMQASLFCLIVNVH